MSNKHPLVQQIENSQLKQDVPSFGPGDTVVVQVKVREATVSVYKHLKVLLSLNVTAA